MRIATGHCNHELDCLDNFVLSKVRLDLACGLIVIGMYVPNSGQKLARLPYRVNDTWARTDLCRHKRFEICRNESLFAKDLQLCLCLCLERAERYGTRCCCHICNNSIRKQLSSHCFVWFGFFITFRNHRPLFWLGWKQRRLGDMWRSQRCTPGHCKSMAD